MILYLYIKTKLACQVFQRKFKVVITPAGSARITDGFDRLILIVKICLEMSHRSEKLLIILEGNCLFSCKIILSHQIQQINVKNKSPEMFVTDFPILTLKL